MILVRGFGQEFPTTKSHIANSHTLYLVIDVTVTSLRPEIDVNISPILVTHTHTHTNCILHIHTAYCNCKFPTETEISEMSVSLCASEFDPGFTTGHPVTPKRVSPKATRKNSKKKRFACSIYTHVHTYTHRYTQKKKISEQSSSDFRYCN